MNKYYITVPITVYQTNPNTSLEKRERNENEWK